MKYSKILTSIILFIFSLWFHFNYPEIKKINKEELSPIINMEDYGFKEFKVYDSLLGKAKYDDHIGSAYQLNLNCSDDSDSYYIEVMIYEWEDYEIAEEYYKNEVELVRQEYIRRVGNGSYYDSYVPKLPYDKAIEYMFPVDLEEWHVDEGYSTTDIHTESTSEMSSVFIVLFKDNQVMSIEYNNDLLLDSDNIKIFNDLFEKSETLFQ